MGRPYLNFDEIKARADILVVVERYGVQLRKVKTDQYSGKCPLPSHTNEKEANSFGVNSAKGVFKCFSDSCRKAGSGSQGNVLDLVRLMDGGSAYDAALKLREWFPDGGWQNPEVKTSPPAPAPEVNRPLGWKFEDAVLDYCHPMIQARKITEETARAFGVGAYIGKGKTMANRIVFALTSGDELLGYAGRIIEPKDGEPKWKLPPGFCKGSYLYGLDRCDPSGPVVVVESPWAVLFLHQNGAQAVALLGCEMSPEQCLALSPFKVVTVALDNDAAGESKAASIVERLKAAGHKVFKARLVE